MGKKASVSEVLSEGKAKSKKACEAKEPSLPKDLEVPLTAKLPGGQTLKAFMKKQKITYEEAVEVYMAYKKEEEKENRKIAKHGLPVATPVRSEAKPSKVAKQKPEAESEALEDVKPKSKDASKRKEQPSKNEPKASKKVKKGKEPEPSDAEVEAMIEAALDNVEAEEAQEADPVKKKLKFNTPEKEVLEPASTPTHRVSSKRSAREATGKDAGEGEAAEGRAKLHRSNAADISTPTSSEKPLKGILKRGWLLI